MPEENADQTDLASLSAVWEADGFFVGGGYERHGRMLTGSTNASGAVAIPSTAAEEGYRAIAGYAGKWGKVAGVAQKLTKVGGKDAVDAVVLGGVASYNIGNSVVKAQCLQRDDAGSDKGATMIAVGIDHNFGQQVTVYLAYVTMLNDDGSNYSLSGDGHGENVVPATGSATTGVGLGAIYKF
jgi:predicted porin